VIDDDKNVQELMSRYLKREGYDVLTAMNGEQGLEKARSWQPDAITLDVMMPELDGWATLSRLKADPQTCHIPVVMLSIVDDRGRGFALGAADYLTKPVDWQQLNGILKRFDFGIDAPILVIDDDLSNRELVRRFLEREGRLVLEAENGRAGLQQIASRMPRLILLDLMMPELDGFEFLAEFEKRFPGARVPVIVLTAKVLTDEDYARLQGRVAHILEKEGVRQLEELTALVRQVVQSAKAVSPTPLQESARTSPPSDHAGQPG
jgi:CheY-like chemotaxis protein